MSELGLPAQDWTPKHRELGGGGVLLTLCADAIEFGPRHTRYSPRALIETVLVRKESAISLGYQGPSYVWGRFEIDEDGTPEPVFDYGKLARSVAIPGHPRHARRINPVLYEHENAGPWSVLLPHTSVAEVAGTFSIGADDFLLRHRSWSYRCSHEYDEWDTDYDIELLYVEPHNHAPLRLPVRADWRP